MIEEIKIICDRCGIKVHGARAQIEVIESGGGFWTSGYYDLTDPYWKQFAIRDEKKICDECMFQDSRYQNR